MGRNFIKIVLAVFLPVVLGCAAILPIVNSDNGYVAGYIFLPIFLLVGFGAMCLLICGLISLANKDYSSSWLFLAALLLPASFFLSAMTAKHFELGAYRQEPMISIDEGVDNIVIFKESTTNDQINDFWDKTLSLEQEDERGINRLAVVRTMIRIQSQNDHEAMGFGFFPNATEEQRQLVFGKVKSSSIVEQLLENQSIKEFKERFATPSPVSSSDKPSKKIVTNSQNFK